MDPVAHPFFSDWGFWAVVIAAVAVLLSQLPPVRDLLRRTRIQVDPYDRLTLTHWLGNPNIHWFLQLRNTGGRKVRIESINLRLSSDHEAGFEVRAQSFAPPDNSTASFLFTPLTLKPDQEWASVVHFFRPFSAADERATNQFIKPLKKDITDKLKARRRESSEVSGPVEADTALVEPAIKFFEKTNIWAAGEYQLVLKVLCDPPRVSVSRSFRFVLFESDIQELEESVENFKYGWGVCYPDQDATPAHPRVTELP
jgi:hypothetical protein